MSPRWRRWLFEAVGGVLLLLCLVLGFVPVALVVLLVQVVLAGGWLLLTTSHASGAGIDFDALSFDPGLGELFGGSMIPPWVMAVSVSLQQVLFVGLALVLVFTLSALRHGRRPRGERVPALMADLRGALALRATRWRSQLLAVLGALSLIGACNGLGALLAHLWPGLDASSMVSIREAIDSSATWELLLLLPTLCVIGPIGEELLFRGCIWSALDRWLAWPLVVLVTMVIFAAFHMSPLHILTILPAGLYLGWLRVHTRSNFAPILCHVVYNSMATVVHMQGWSGLGGLGPSTECMVLAGVGGALATALCMGLVWWKGGEEGST